MSTLNDGRDSLLVAQRLIILNPEIMSISLDQNIIKTQTEYKNQNSVVGILLCHTCTSMAHYSLHRLMIYYFVTLG